MRQPIWRHCARIRAPRVRGNPVEGWVLAGNSGSIPAGAGEGQRPDLLTSDRCMVWTGASIAPNQFMRRQFDRIIMSKVKASSRIMFRGERTSVQRALNMLMKNPTSPFRSHQICSTPLCVNPQHWTFTELAGQTFDDDETPRPNSASTTNGPSRTPRACSTATSRRTRTRPSIQFMTCWSTSPPAQGGPSKC